MGKILYSIPLRQLIEELQLKICYMPQGGEETLLTRYDITRPGLSLAGFFGHFEAARVQIIGRSEYEYMRLYTPAERHRRLDDYLHRKPVAVIVAHDLPVDDDFLLLARTYEVPILTTTATTSDTMTSVVTFLRASLAPRTTMHGVLVDVYGEGVLITGDSGIGKSETAIELVKRGHRLIADDAVEIKKITDRRLNGTAPQLIRYFIELRGIGVVDVRRIFGMGAVRDDAEIDLNIHLENWVEGKMYDRFGLESQTTEIMGVQIPMTVVPVRPGRNLAIIIEIAAMNNRQKKMGYNTAEEFDRMLREQAASMPPLQ